MKKKTKKVEKIFECKGHCKDQYVDMLVFACPKCIKKVAPLLSEEVKRVLRATFIIATN